VGGSALQMSLPTQLAALLTLEWRENGLILMAMFSAQTFTSCSRALGRPIVPAFAVVLMIISARAATVPGRWEKVELLQPGSEVSVLLISGELAEGTFEGVEGDQFLLGTGRTTLPLETSGIYRVTTSYVEKGSPVKGALWGLVAGAAFGGILVATDGSAGFVSDPGESGFTGGLSSGGHEWENKGAIVAGSAAVGCLLGFLIDVSVDPMEVQHEVVYQAP
jgi:hypothetical protein